MAQGEGDNASGTMQAGHRPLMSPPPWPLPAILSRGKIAGDLASVPGVGRSPCHQCHFRSSGMSPAHPHIRPITPFLRAGGVDLRGEARSSTTGDLWRWVFSHPGREAGSGTNIESRVETMHREQDLSTPTRPAQGFPQPGFVSKTDKTDRHFRNGASRRVCYGSGCLEDAKTLKTDDRTQAPSKTDKTYNSFSHHRFF